MADYKNGFLLYKDLIHSVRKLPKEKAGELFLHILEYVNDEEPETDCILIELAFEPVKQSLKRDLKKYEKTKERNRENAIKRWQKPPSEPIPNDATACDRMQPFAKHADSDSVSDIGSGSDSDILLEKETKEGEILISVEPDKIHELEERKKVAPKKEIEFPFPTKEFKAGWDLWKAYRKKNDKFQYFDNVSEQKALTELFNLSKMNEATALAIIRQSIDKGWKGFFELKNKTNGYFETTAGSLAKARRR